MSADLSAIATSASSRGTRRASSSIRVSAPATDNTSPVSALTRGVRPAVDSAPRSSYVRTIARAKAGTDLLTISKLLGHADTRETSRHYAHLCDRTLANAVNAPLPDFGAIEQSNVTAIR